jgi:hypothetical protein
MAQKTEKLNEVVYKQLVDLQSEMDNMVFTIGQIHMQIRESETKLKNLQSKFDKKNEQMGDVLETLKSKYPVANINLEDGTITFEEN